jgi:hypothetical protein
MRWGGETKRKCRFFFPTRVINNTHTFQNTKMPRRSRKRSSSPRRNKRSRNARKSKNRRYRSVMVAKTPDRGAEYIVLYGQYGKVKELDVWKTTPMQLFTEAKYRYKMTNTKSDDARNELWNLVKEFEKEHKMTRSQAINKLTETGHIELKRQPVYRMTIQSFEHVPDDSPFIVLIRDGHIVFVAHRDENDYYTQYKDMAIVDYQQVIQNLADKHTELKDSKYDIPVFIG